MESDCITHCVHIMLCQAEKCGKAIPVSSSLRLRNHLPRSTIRPAPVGGDSGPDKVD